MKKNSVKNDGNLTPAQPFPISDLVAYSANAIVSRTLTKKQAGTLTLFAFDVNEELSEHTAPFDAYVHVLDGSAELTIGGKKLTVTAGDIVLMPAHIPHAVSARQRFKMLLIMIRE